MNTVAVIHNIYEPDLFFFRQIGSEQIFDKKKQQQHGFNNSEQLRNKGRYGNLVSIFKPPHYDIFPKPYVIDLH